MPFQNTIERVTNELNETSDQLDTCFDLSFEMRQFQPAPGEWTIDEILEHITLTSHFLLITLRQSLPKVLRRAQIEPIPEGESDLDRVTCIRDPDAFGWIRPEHMAPTGTVSSDEVRVRMKAQHDECLTILNQIRLGEGALHRVRMSVQDLGK